MQKMNGSLKNFLLLNKFEYLLFYKKKLVAFYFFLLYFININGQQFANHITNGSFEYYYNCFGSFAAGATKGWLAIDSNSICGGLNSICNNRVPLNSNTYQFPRTGKACMINSIFCPNVCPRGYPKNRLKQNLQFGKTYCVKFFVNICNTSPRGIDGVAIYFGDSSIDTITKCNGPITYLTPQVKNPLGNVITDTLNWVPISGTFVATGIEKYALLGNFLADNAVTTASIGGPFYPQNWTDVLIDDVSCIDIDLPAYAGPDKSIIPGDSIFVGREPDIGIDEACMWYKLPTIVTPTTPALDTVAGLWVKPITTTTYIVRQQLWCSGVKWDTVVVHMDYVGLKKLELFSEGLSFFPNPTGNKLGFSKNIPNQIFKLSILNLLGQKLFINENFKMEEEVEVDVSFLPKGIYYLKIENETRQKVFKVLKE